MEEWPEFTDDLDFLDAHDVVIISDQQMPVKESQMPTIPVWAEEVICDAATKLIIDAFKAASTPPPPRPPRWWPEDNPPE